MDFLKKLFGGSPAKSVQHVYTFSVKCKRCGEVITGRVDLNNDLSAEYEDGSDIFFARKVLMGENKCFQRVEVELKFNSARQLLKQHATGGEFV